MVVRDVPRWAFTMVVIAIVAALSLTFVAVSVVSGDSHDTTYYGCLFGGSLSQVNTNAEPSNCGRGVPVSWNGTGIQGPQGEPGPQGEQGLVWQGDWDAAFNEHETPGYAENDAVHHNGSAWISRVDGNTEEPGDNAVNWDLLAAQGEQGIQGIQGIQGEQGVQGDQGLVWQGNWDADYDENDNPGYAENDAVHHDGSAWISLVDDNTEEPGDSAVNWDLLAAQGEQGIQGIQGIQGEGQRTLSGVVKQDGDILFTPRATPGRVSYECYYIDFHPGAFIPGTIPIPTFQSIPNTGQLPPTDGIPEPAPPTQEVPITSLTTGGPVPGDGSARVDVCFAQATQFIYVVVGQAVN